MTNSQRNLTAIVFLATSLLSAPTSHARYIESIGSLVLQSPAQPRKEESAGKSHEPARAWKSVLPGVLNSAAVTRSKRDRPRLLAEPFETPRQLLRLLDIGPSDLSSFVDGQPISVSDEEAFLKVLFRMPQIGLDDIARWTRHPVPWAALRTDSAQRRGEFFLLRGRVHSIARKPVRARLAALFAFDHYYEVRIEVDATFHVIVCTRAIPQAWHGQQKLDQRCRVSGMFLKLDATKDRQPQFLFAARRIGWLPDRPDRDLGIGPAQVLLGDLGMDVGLFDAVRSRNGLPIGAAERECFYALLHAVGRADADELARHATPMRLGPLLQQPRQLHGDVLHVLGSVRRITRVAVDERDIQQRFGIDHYYQLDVFVPLEDAEVQVKGEQEGVPGPVYRSNFPFTCCALAIPAQWEPFVGKEQASARVVLNGFFFKLWAYSNPYVASFDQKQRQLSPMLILREPTPARSVGKTNSAVHFAMGAGFLAVLAAIWTVVWLLGRADRKHADSGLQQRFKPRGQPDFKHLEGPGE